MFGFGWIKDKGKAIADTSKQVIGVDEIKNNYNYIVETGKVLVTPPNQSKLIKGKKEIVSFSDYMKKNNISEKDLVSMSRNVTIAFYLVLLGLIGCAISGTVGFFIHDSLINSIMQFLTCISIGLLMFVLSLRFAYDSYQIRTKQLISFKDFLKQNDRWPAFYHSQSKAATTNQQSHSTQSQSAKSFATRKK